MDNLDKYFNLLASAFYSCDDMDGWQLDENDSEEVELWNKSLQAKIKHNFGLIDYIITNSEVLKEKISALTKE